MPNPDQTVCVPRRRALSLRAALTPTCRLNSGSLPHVAAIYPAFLPLAFSSDSSLMMKFGEAADETTFHFRHYPAQAQLLFIKIQKLIFHGLAQGGEIGSLYGITH
jgi:hypothetical protein